MAKLILGPLLRYVGETEAVLWVETDEPCEVEVLGHHRAHLLRRRPPLRARDRRRARAGRDPRVRGRARRRAGAGPRTTASFPPSVIRTLGGDGPLRLCFGSCRVSLPHHAPYTLPKDDSRGRRASSTPSTRSPRRCSSAPPEEWPHALLLLGDQVYADEVSPETLAFIRKRRDIRKPPGEEVADFEEYTRLYRESWADPAIRWLFSTVSCSMVVDDHDINDDWNISAAWVEEMRREPTGGPSASARGSPPTGSTSSSATSRPSCCARASCCAGVREADDGWEVLREFAANERRHPRRRPLELLPRPRPHPADRARLALRADPRGGPALDPRRGGVGMARGPPRGRLRPPADRDLGPVPARARPAPPRALGRGDLRRGLGRARRRLGEKLRRALDFDHWAAFGDSFERLAGLLARAGAGRYGPPPASITVLSGDVHHAYLAEVALPALGRGAERASGRRSARRFATRSTTASAR